MGATTRKKIEEYEIGAKGWYYHLADFVAFAAGVVFSIVSAVTRTGVDAGIFWGIFAWFCVLHLGILWTNFVDMKWAETAVLFRLGDIGAAIAFMVAPPMASVVAYATMPLVIVTMVFNLFLIVDMRTTYIWCREKLGEVQDAINYNVCHVTVGGAGGDDLFGL